MAYTKPKLTTVSAGGKKWTVNEQYAAKFQGFLQDALAMGLVKDNPKTAKVEGFYSSGGYNYRPIVGSKTGKLSNHAFGAAIDISAGENGLGALTGSIDPTTARTLAAKYGLRWGGDYKNRKDLMHFEVVGANGETGSRTPVPSSSMTGALSGLGLGAGRIFSANGRYYWVPGGTA